MPTKKERARLIQLYNQGKSHSEIGKEMGRAKSTVCDWLKPLIRDGVVDSPLERAAKMPLASKYDKAKAKTATAAATNLHFGRNEKLALCDLLLRRIRAIARISRSAGDMRNLTASIRSLTETQEMLNGPEKADVVDDGFMDALSGKASEVWDDVDVKDLPVQVDKPKLEAMADPDLVAPAVTDPAL